MESHCVGGGGSVNDRFQQSESGSSLFSNNTKFETSRARILLGPVHGGETGHRSTKGQSLEIYAFSEEGAQSRRATVAFSKTGYDETKLDLALEVSIHIEAPTRVEFRSVRRCGRTTPNSAGPRSQQGVCRAVPHGAAMSNPRPTPSGLEPRRVGTNSLQLGPCWDQNSPFYGLIW